MKAKKAKSIKVVSIMGTRPEVIRLSCTLARLDEFTQHIMVHTGQNHDYELNEIFFEELNIRKPDHFLGVDTSSLGKTLGDVISRTEEVLRAELPDAVLILGDTNSSISGIIAKRMKIPVYHMEAGNRCFDLNVPEEINRRIIDHIADFNLVYTENSRRHLISEGIPHRKIYLTGSPMREVLLHHMAKIKASNALSDLGLSPQGYLLVSAHREENVDDRQSLQSILAALKALVDEYGKTVLVSTHPRTLKRIRELGDVKFHDKIVFNRPFGFLDYVHLQMNAYCTLSDSGTISEESAILGFPAVTIRTAMERPEALDAGTIILTGLKKETILSSVDLAVEEHRRGIAAPPPQEYLVENTSWRVVKLILGTAGLSNDWAGIRRWS